MADDRERLEALQELVRRNAIPDDRKPYVDEMIRRGLLKASDADDSASLRNRQAGTSDQRRHATGARVAEQFNKDAPYSNPSDDDAIIGHWAKGLPPDRAAELSRRVREYEPDFAGRVLRSASLGTKDEITAGINAPITAASSGKSIPDAYDDELRVQRAMRDKEAQQLDGTITGTTADLASMVINPFRIGAKTVQAVRNAATAPSVASIAKVQPHLAWEGAKVGGANAFFDADGSSDPNAGIGDHLLERASRVPEGVVHGAVGGVAIGNAFGAYGAARAMKDARAAERATANMARRGEAQAAGIDNPLPAIVSDSPVLSTATQASGSLPAGGPIARQARENLNAVDAGIAGTLREHTGGLEAGAAGESVKGTLQRAVNSYSMPHERVERMSPDDRVSLTGIAPVESQMPKLEPVKPVKPVPVREMTQDEYIGSRVADVKDVPPKYPPPREPAEPAPLTADPPPVKELSSRQRAVSDEIAQIDAQVSGPLTQRQQIAAARLQEEPFFRTPEFGRYQKAYTELLEGLAQEGAAPMSASMQRTMRSLESIAGRDEAKRIIGDYRTARLAEIEMERLGARREALRREAEDLQPKIAESVLSERQRLIEEAKAKARREADDLIALDRKAAEEAALKETQAERSRVRDVAAANAEDGVFWENRRRQQEAEREALQRTAEVGRAADQQHQDRIARIRAQERPFEAGSTRESYKTEFEIAYDSAFKNIPGNVGNPLGSKDRPLTAVGRLLARVGKEGVRRQQVRAASAYPFDNTGAIRPEMLSYITRLAGPEIGQRLAVLSEQRAGGSLAAPGIRTWHELRSDIGNAIDAALAHQRRTGEALPIDRRFLARLQGALSEDMHRIVRSRGPEGARASDVLRQVDLEYRRYQRDIVRPLARIFGEQVDTVKAMDRLSEAARTGEVRTLRAYTRVMSDKETPARGAAFVLSHMIGNGQSFADVWRTLPRPTRDILLASPAGRQMEARLDNYARVLERLEPYRRIAEANGNFDYRRGRHLAFGATFLAHLPTGIAAAAGNWALASTLASPRLTTWLTTAPNIGRRYGWQSPQMERHISGLTAFAGSRTSTPEERRAAGAMADITRRMIDQQGSDRMLRAADGSSAAIDSPSLRPLLEGFAPIAMSYPDDARESDAVEDRRGEPPEPPDGELDATRSNDLTPGDQQEADALRAEMARLRIGLEGAGDETNPAAVAWVADAERALAEWDARPKTNRKKFNRDMKKMPRSEIRAN